jgi:hypothetical protein
MGAVLRLESRPGLSAAREVHAGSGYWSQESASQVLALPEGPSRLVVRWPGGRSTTSQIPPGAGAVTVDTNGNLTVLHAVGVRAAPGQ